METPPFISRVCEASPYRKAGAIPNRWEISLKKGDMVYRLQIASYLANTED